MSALAPLADGDRQRLLALIGIDVYVRRAPREPRPAVAEPAMPRQRVSAPAPAPAAARVLQLECDLADAGPQPLSGPYAALLRQLLQAIGVPAREVRFAPLAGEGAVDCMRITQGAQNVECPSLEQVRKSGVAKRELWKALRALRRQRAAG